MKLEGLFSALLTPIHEDGKIDLDTISELIHRALKAGINGICIGGATSEFPHFEIPQRKELISFASQELEGRGKLITAIGTSSFPQSLDLGRYAADAGSDALLLPMPYFFHYDQVDLVSYCHKLAHELDLPLLIYNLPQFTQQLTLDAIIELITSERNIIGIKDSSGDSVNLKILADARLGNDFELLVGDDSLLLNGLSLGWDGAVSGISCCCPELLVSLFSSIKAGDLKSAEEYDRLLQELIAQVSRMPFPWGLKSIVEEQGMRMGPRSLPQSEKRKQQDRELKEWFSRWWNRIGPNLSTPDSSRVG